MASRFPRARSQAKARFSGNPQLTLSSIIVTAENLLKIFAKPLLLVGGFIAMAWLGVFTDLYPWAHLVALILFVLFLFDSLGQGLRHWKSTTASEAKRRVEESSGLTHRPLDVLEDRPTSLDSEQIALWQAHTERARAQTVKLRWPKWKLDLAERDPYALRYAVLFLLMIGTVYGWGALGGRLINAINPNLGKQLHFLNPTLDAWITPPDYTGLPPIMIATPAEARHGNDVIDVPDGSTISAHLAEKDGTIPTLSVNGDRAEFVTDDHGDFEVNQVVHSGDTIAIHRGWQKLGSWHIRVVPDTAPHIAFTDPPSNTERKSVRLAYDATDDYGVTSVTARISPRESTPGANNEPFDITLSAPGLKDVKRVNFADLTAHPWAGTPVTIQLLANDAVGHQSASEAVDFTLPERIFTQPVARALIEERKKLLQNPDDENLRNETANIMAGIAHQPENYKGDPVVLMALRSGAVRLVLDHSPDVIEPIQNVLWQTAVRIEDGAVGMAEQNLRDAQNDLADALDRNASEQEIQKLIDRLHQALAQYLAELSTRMAAKPGPMEDLSQIMGPQTNMLTPDDLHRMLEQMRNLSASGARDAARQELSKLQQMLENLRTEPQPLTQEQIQALQRMKELRQLTQQQQQLLDKTFQSAQSSNKQDAKKLAAEQNDLLKRLQDLLGGVKGKNGETLSQGAGAMKEAESNLQQGAVQGAVPHQNDAIKAMQQALQSMQSDMQASLSLGAGMRQFGNSSDPFGRNFGGLPQDDGSVKVPDQMETRRVREILDELQRRAGDMNRPKPERDYIERLLQNF